MCAPSYTLAPPLRPPRPPLRPPKNPARSVPILLLLSYTKVYFGKLYGEFVTLEDYLEGEFQKYVNNTGEIFGKSELTLKGESFGHYTYERSGQQLIVLDIQGVDHSLFDTEVASSTLIDSSDKTILFCCGNLSTDAIDRFKEEHVCNKFCHMLKLNEM